MLEINKTFCIDNLEMLRKLPNESVDLIYCDILYNTGQRFRDYNDNLGTPLQAVEWYKPRFIEMKRILKTTGNMLLQMDYRLVHYLKVELDNIFGLENFQDDIIWWYYNSNSGNSKRALKKKKDNILWYSKTKDYYFNDIEASEPLNEKQLKRFSKTDEDGRRYYNNVSQDGKKVRVYLKEDKRVMLQNVWQIPIPQKVEYNTQKPEELLQRIIKIFSKEGDIVADFFCGSGTTGVVAKKLNRYYIMCDISQKAIDISNNRLNDAS